MTRAGIVLAASAALAACHPSTLPPEGQILFYFDTDAILPPAPGEDLGGQMPLFDRLRVEIFPSGAADPCEGCQREIGLDHRTVFEGRASFGVVPPPGDSGVRARLRLYRSAGADVVSPRPTSTLEAVVLLPPVPADGIVEVHAVLLTDDLGAPRGTLDDPAPALAGAAPGGLAGTWAAAYRRGCAGAPGPGEVCIPGGAYWMGNPTFDTPSERLVAVSPFYLDASEVTVRSLRDSGLGTISAVVSHDTTPDCTYTSAPGMLDGYPVNCVTYQASGDYCAKKGGRLVTEAEWELVAGARRSARYVWGDDPPTCGDAVYARSSAGQPPALTACAALGLGAQPTGTGARDRLDVTGGPIVDLIGNLSEWMADAWAKEGEPCWSAPLLYDPLCTTASTIDPYSLALRGGNWSDPADLLQAAVREKLPAAGTNKASVHAGFRCARPAP